MINMILYELKFNKTAVKIASSLIYGSICIAGVLFFGIKYISAGEIHNFLNPKRESRFLSTTSS